MKVREMIAGLSNWLAAPPSDPDPRLEGERDRLVSESFARREYEKRLMQELGNALKGKKQIYDD